MTTETVITAQKGGNGEAEKPLTPQEMLFVKGYVGNGGNGVRAYGGAGYSTKAGDGGASSASALLRRPRVARAIQAALVEAGYSPDGLRSKLMVFAANNPLDLSLSLLAIRPLLNWQSPVSIAAPFKKC